MTALETLKDATAKALVEAIENKNVPMVKQLFTIYYEVQQITIPMDYQYNLDFDNSKFQFYGDTIISSGENDDILTL